MIGDRLKQYWQRFYAWAEQEPGAVAAWGLVVTFGIFVLVRGKDVSWDVRNYHWYNPYALITGRRGYDIAVAQHATYYNPMIDVPVYLGAQVFPAWLVGLLLGLFQGLNAILLYAIAKRALRAEIPGPRRSWIAFVIALVGMLGGMSLQLAGVLSQDLTLSVFALGAVALLMRLDEREAGSQDDLLRVGFAGLSGGLAVGFKLAMASYPFGLIAGVLALVAPWPARFKRLAALGAGGLLGAFVTGGSWTYTLWHETGNPVFPYFNQYFGSPLLLAASYRDERFLPRGLWETLTYPFVFSFDGLRVADASFRDVKVMLAYVLVPIALVLWAAGRQAGERLFTDRAARLLFAFAAASYVVWLEIYSIYRYAVTLEMLAPLLIAIAIDFVPVALRYRTWACGAVFAVAVAAVGWSNAIDARPAWGSRYITVEAPALASPNDTMVLMAGTEPSSYIIPSFPELVPFLRIDSWLDTPQSHTRLGDIMRSRVRAHRGALFGVFADWERERARAAFADYGLTFDPSMCSAIVSNAGPPLSWCPLDRRALARAAP